MLPQLRTTGRRRWTAGRPRRQGAGLDDAGARQGGQFRRRQPQQPAVHCGVVFAQQRGAGQRGGRGVQGEGGAGVFQGAGCGMVNFRIKAPGPLLGAVEYFGGGVVGGDGDAVGLAGGIKPFAGMSGRTIPAYGG